MKNNNCFTMIKKLMYSRNFKIVAFGLTTLSMIYFYTIFEYTEVRKFKTEILHEEKSSVPSNNSYDYQTDTGFVPLLNIHKLSMKEPYLSRILKVRKVCSLYKKKPKLTKTKTTFKYVDKISLVMCETPKVASTTWQLALLRLSGFKGTFTEKLKKKWAYSIIPNKTFKTFADNEIWEMMRSYTTFLIARHPFERLVSAFYDKLTNKAAYDYYRKTVGKQIAKHQISEYLSDIKISHYQRNLTKRNVENLSIFKHLTSDKQEKILNYLDVLQTGEVSFSQFVKFLLGHSNVGSMDIHWRPQSLLCQPCLFNYSYIMKFDNLTQDSNHLLDYLQTSYNLSTSLIEQVRFTKKVVPKTKSSLTEETIRMIPESQVATLRKLYQDDFLLYDYDPYLYKGYV